jgi:hypothetical protein
MAYLYKHKQTHYTHSTSLAAEDVISPKPDQRSKCLKMFNLYSFLIFVADAHYFTR